LYKVVDQLDKTLLPIHLKIFTLCGFKQDIEIVEDTPSTLCNKYKEI